MPFAIAILGPVTVFLVVGITEELLARGYQLRNLSEGFNGAPFAPRTAILVSWVISSSLFGLLHIFNPNATWLSILYLMLAGLFLGLGAVLTGRLGLPIGVHITWNLFQGSVYGFPVSGNLFPSARVLVIEQGGPPVWTGSAFGPEAGLIGIAAILLGCLCTLAWVQFRYRSLRVYRPLAVYRPLRAPPARRGAGHTLTISRCYPVLPTKPAPERSEGSARRNLSPVGANPERFLPLVGMTGS